MGVDFTYWTDDEKELLQAEITALKVLTDDELLGAALKSAKDSNRAIALGLAVTKELLQRGVIDLKNPASLADAIKARKETV